MKLYTKKGDKGSTSIIGQSDLQKDDERIEAYGTVDELNSILGLTGNHCHQNLNEKLQKIQVLLFELGSDLASKTPRNSIKESDILELEHLIDNSEKQLPSLSSFILPGGSHGSSLFHLARTIARRAERRIVTLSKTETINKNIVPFVNRLSDLFFTWARLNNHLTDTKDIVWDPRK